MTTTPPSANSLASRVNLITTIATAIIAVAAFALSAFNYLDANGEPEVAMAPPSLLRISLVDTGRTRSFIILMQPTFTLAKASSRTAVVGKVSLELRNGDAALTAQPVYLDKITYDNNGNEAMEYTGDFGPVVVSQGSGGAPMVAFYVVSNTLKPGEWAYTLTATLSGGAILANNGCIWISGVTAQSINSTPDGVFKFYRNFAAINRPAGEGNPACYR